MTWQQIQIRAKLRKAFINFLLGEKLPFDIVDSETGEIIVPANRKVSRVLIGFMVDRYDHLDIDPSPLGYKIREIIEANIQQTTININISLTLQQIDYSWKLVDARLTK